MRLRDNPAIKKLAVKEIESKPAWMQAQQALKKYESDRLKKLEEEALKKVEERLEKVKSEEGQFQVGLLIQVRVRTECPCRKRLKVQKAASENVYLVNNTPIYRT